MELSDKMSRAHADGAFLFRVHGFCVGTWANFAPSV
jgi:hypothetical protein